MEIFVLDKNFEVIGIFDSFQSLICCKRYNDIGALDLQIEANNDTLSIFKKGNYITHKFDETVYRIEAIELDTNEEKDNHLIVGAYDIKKFLFQRIVYETEKYDDTVENVIRGLITNNIIEPAIQERKIENFELKQAKGFEEKIKTQITFDVVGEKISDLCKTYNYGYKVYFENEKIYFDLYRGVDRSVNQTENQHIVFSPEYDNLFSSKYTLDISEVKNVGLVAGEGEGNQRKKIEVGSAIGLERFEMFIDADDISSEEGSISDTEYKRLLMEKGHEELSQNLLSTTFEGVVDTELYKYKVDFDLGDIVTLQNEYGITVDARIVEVIETWNEDGYSLEPKFEYFEVADFSTQITESLTTENGIMLLSEIGEPLLAENSTSVEGTKISELPEADLLDAGCCFPIVQYGETKKITFENLQNEIITTETIDNWVVTKFHKTKIVMAYKKITVAPNNSTSQAKTINFPITMLNTDYSVQLTLAKNGITVTGLYESNSAGNNARKTTSTSIFMYYRSASSYNVDVNFLLIGQYV